MMSELLARHTSLPVREAVAGESLEVDHIYLMPAGVLMTIEQEHLVFTPRPLRGTMWTMLGFCVGVLLIACVNVMNMQFARATLRARRIN